MRKRRYFLPIIALSLTGCGAAPLNPAGQIDPFDYDGNFENSELKIDGKMLEPEWNSEYATPMYSFKYTNQINGEKYDYSFKVYRGKRELFVYFEVQDINLLTYGNDNGSSVSYSDSCEVYIDTLKDGGAKPQSDDYQIDLGIHGKTRILVGTGAGWSSSTAIVQYETDVRGTINDESDVDEGYSIEMAIPYKQVLMERDQEIGITFGIVDRYQSIGGMTSKKWFGTNIKGHYGNPQNPSSYFTLKKNEVAIPPLPEYIPEEDTRKYATGRSLVVREREYQGLVYQSVSMQVERDGSTISALLTASSKWSDYEGVMVTFDFGDYNRSERDENTLIFRAYPGLGSVKDFYSYPNTGLSRTGLLVQVDETHMLVSFDIDSYFKGFDGDVALCLSTIELENQTLVKTMNDNGRPCEFTQISSCPQIGADNEFVPYVDPFEYKESEDTAEYIEGLDCRAPECTDSGDAFSSISYKVARHESLFEIKGESESEWKEDELLMFKFDMSPEGKQEMDEDTYIVRVFPLAGSVMDFFSYPRQGQDRSAVKVYKNKTQVKIIVDFSSIETYTSDGVGVSFSTCHRNASKILVDATWNGVSVTRSSPSSYPRLFADNTISEIIDPRAYDPSKDDTPYNLEKEIAVPEIEKDGKTYGPYQVKVHRSIYKATFLVHSDREFSKADCLMFQFDLGAKGRSVRDSSTFVLRVFPSECLIKDFFAIGGIKQENDFVSMKFNKEYIKVTVDFGIIAQRIPAYEDQGIGYSFAACDASMTVLSYNYVDGTKQGTNPSVWPRLDKHNAYVG